MPNKAEEDELEEQIQKIAYATWLDMMDWCIILQNNAVAQLFYVKYKININVFEAYIQVNKER